MLRPVAKDEPCIIEPDRRKRRPTLLFCITRPLKAKIDVCQQRAA
jgi:hypothetical protein